MLRYIFKGYFIFVFSLIAFAFGLTLGEQIKINKTEIVTIVDNKNCINGKMK